MSIFFRALVIIYSVYFAFTSRKIYVKVINILTIIITLLTLIIIPVVYVLEEKLRSKIRKKIRKNRSVFKDEN